MTPEEIERVLRTAGQSGRHGHRDRTLVLIAYRHGLRVGELVGLRWDQVDLKAGLLHVARLKNGIASTHPIRWPELRALRELHRQYPDSSARRPTRRPVPGALSSWSGTDTGSGGAARDSGGSGRRRELVLPAPSSSATVPFRERVKPC
ncbi:MAG: tyrosine-type recombinase/integrase [Steroidobacteraceae bacterium]